MNKTLKIISILVLVVALFVLVSCTQPAKTGTTTTISANPTESDITTATDDVNDLSNLTTDLDKDISFQDLEDAPLN